MSSAFEATRAQLDYAVNQFLLSFSHVPDDRLFWRPSETSKCAVELAAHIAIVLERQMNLVADIPMEKVPLSTLLPQLREKEQSFKDRASAVTFLETTRNAAVVKLRDLPEERLQAKVLFFDRELPMRAMLSVLVNHVWIHTGQIDYLQTIWGDMTPRFF